MAELLLRTTITANSVHRRFGIPGSALFKPHPGNREAEMPQHIFKCMKVKEAPPVQDIKFLKGTVYSYKNRKIITRWLRDVSAAFQLKTTSLALAIQLTDAFIIGHLSALEVSRCQLVAVSALWVAAKFEELDDAVMKTKNLVDVCDNAYTADEILDMEIGLLTWFKWRIPHTTIVNHLYLLLHMHSCASFVSLPDLNSAPATDAIVTIEIILMNPLTKQRDRVLTTTSGTMTFEQTLPAICAAAHMPCSSNVVLFELFGDDILLARRLSLVTMVGTRSQPSVVDGKPVVRVFPSNGGSANRDSGSSVIFAERDEIALLRTINSLILHLTLEVLAPEAMTHVEFLRLPSHVVALGVLALARCMLSTCMTEVRRTLLALAQTLDISGAMALAAADLLCDKYAEALQQGNLEQPIPLPHDIRDRLRFIFSK